MLNISCVTCIRSLLRVSADVGDNDNDAIGVTDDVNANDDDGDDDDDSSDGDDDNNNGLPIDGVDSNDGDDDNIGDDDDNGTVDMAKWRVAAGVLGANRGVSRDADIDEEREEIEDDNVDDNEEGLDNDNDGTYDR